MNTDDIRRLYAYTNWASHKVLDAAAQLSPEEQQRETGASHSSIHGTLVHTMSAEWIWLERWKGTSPPGLWKGAEFADLAAIRTRWEQLEADRQQFIEGLTDQALAEAINYRDTKGNPYSMPLGLLMQHVVNHSTLHRGQLVVMLRQAGVQPPATDLLYYLLPR
ncbi:MAG: DinB family protein [Blastocatellia bacterium]